VSSFANASGGDILYGIEEDKGVPVSIPGAAITDADAEKLRLENVIRTSIQPRVLGIQSKTIGGFAQGPVLLMRIPRSWTAPHVVTHGGAFRFYTRNSAGKHPMDISELRAAFALSESVPERMRRFRDDRLAKIITGGTPVSLCRGQAYAVLHLLPLSAFTDTGVVDTSAIYPDWLLPVETKFGGSRRLNIDGVVVSVHRDNSPSYVQLFRNGTMEIAHEIGGPRQEKSVIFPIEYEKQFVDALCRYFKFLNELEITPPVFILAAVYGAKGCTIYEDGRFLEQHPIDREILSLPEVEVHDYAERPENVMRYPFDVVWNAVGLPGSLNYDGDVWKPRHS
jgi:hypothetical protein